MAKNKLETIKKKGKNGEELTYYRYRFSKANKNYEVSDKTKAGAKRKYDELIKSLGMGLKDNKEVFINFAKVYIFETKAARVTHKTIYNYEILFRLYIENSNLRNMKLHKIKSEDIQYLYNDMHKQGKSEYVIESVHKLLRQIINNARKHGYIVQDLMLPIELPKDFITNEDKLREAIDPAPEFLDEDMKERFVEAVKDSKHELLYLMALSTGLRCGELLALKYDDLDMNTRELKVYKTWSYIKKERDGKREGFATTPKTKSSVRTLTFPASLTEMIKKHRLHHKQQKLKLGDKYKDDGYIFVRESTGRVIDTCDLHKDFKKVLEQADIDKRFKFHGLRHTFATDVMIATMNPKLVQQLLGHSTIELSMKIYMHVSKSVKLAELNKVNSLFDKMIK